MSNVKSFGAAGDGKIDDTADIQHALDQGNGSLFFPRGVYRITRSIEVQLKDKGPSCISSIGGTATILMDAPGPAFRVVGNHAGTGHPTSVKDQTRDIERMPCIRELVIEGRNNDADGIEWTGTMQGRIDGVMIRHCRDGIRLVNRNRNVLISNCHIYHNNGVGIQLDGVNLHQINICNNHISYNRLGGIRIEKSEVRNLQITGNDIEYNNQKLHPDFANEPTAEIYIDTTAPKATVNEITIASNTIQATVSPGGCNIRIVDAPGQDRPPGLWAISGNIIGSQENNVHLTGCHGVVLSGNCIYSCGSRNLLIEKSTQVNIGSNDFRRHTPAMFCGIRLVDSENCVISGCTLKDEHENGQPTGASLLELENCRRITVNGCQFLDGVPYGIDVVRSSWVNIAGCTVADTRKARKAKGAIRFAGKGENNQLAANLVDIDADIGVNSGVKK
jgi:hypothetical protein